MGSTYLQNDKYHKATLTNEHFLAFQGLEF